MAEDKLKIKIDGDESGFKKVLNKLPKEAQAALDKVGNATKKTAKISAKEFAVVGAAITGLTVKAMNLKGELEQNLGGSEQVFKEFAEDIQATAKDAYKNTGLSQSNYLANANKMGALLQGVGMTIEESASITQSVMQRASDVASIMGIDVSAAMEAVTGAAKGNFTMMDNLGVAMNDTTLKIYAQEKGLGALDTTQKKVSVAMQMFLDKTAYAAGNYAKENETLAGSLTTAKAALQNYLSGSGDAEALAESFKNATTVIIDNLEELAPELTEGLGTIISEIGPEIPDMIATLVPVVADAILNLLNTVGDNPEAFADGVVSIVKGLLQFAVRLVPTLFKTSGSLVSALIESIGKELNLISDETLKQERATKAILEKNKALRDERKAREDAHQQRVDAVADSMLEIDYVENLIGQLRNLQDANGNVTAANQKRVDFILGELNEALGTEYTNISQVIDANGNLAQSVYDVIEAKKQEALFSAYEDEYKEAITERQNAFIEYQTTLQELTQKEADFQEIISNPINLREDLIGVDIVDLQKDIGLLGDSVDELRYKLEGYDDVINTVESAQAASSIAESNKILQDGLIGLSGAYQDAANSASSSAEEIAEAWLTSVDTAISTLDRMHTEMASGTASYSEEEFASVEAYIQKLITEGEKSSSEAVRTMASVLNAEISAQKSGVETSSKELGRQIINGISSSITVTPDLSAKIAGVASNIVGLFKAKLKIHSPSKVMRDEVGEMITKGIVVGLQKKKTKDELKREVEDQKKTIVDAYKKMAEEAIDAIDDLSDAQEGFSNKLKDFTNKNLYEKKTVSATYGDGSQHEFSYTKLTDLSETRKQLEDYAYNIEQLRARGISDAFYKEIRDMDVEEGSEYVKALLAADEETFSKYMADWEAIQTFSDAEAKNAYNDEYLDLVSEISKRFGEDIPAELYDIGGLSAKNYGDAFIKQIRDMQPQIMAALQSMYSELSPNLMSAMIGTGFYMGANQNTTNNVYNATYNLQPVGGSTTDALRAIKDYETRKKQRGG